VARKTGHVARLRGAVPQDAGHALEYASFDGRDYRLRPRVLELGMAYFSSHSLVDIANPILAEAADRAGAMFDGGARRQRDRLCRASHRRTG
jgi:IclR family transcriptional regulator, pca regulon regulatory protein